MSEQIVSSREKEILKGIIEILRRRLTPNQIILFGSRGKGKSHQGAGFDFAVDENRPPTREERVIFEEIDPIAGLYDVDIVYLKQVDSAFKELIIKTGKVIYARRD